MKQTSHDIKIRRDRMMPLLLVYATTAVLLFAANIISPGFLTVAHLGNVARQASFLGIVSIGQTLIILTGGIDLSTSYLITLTNIVAAQIMDGKNANIAAACITVLLIGLVAGAINGLGICFMHIPPIVMTLATGNVLLGIAYIYCNGSPKGYRAPLLEQIVNGRVLGVLSGSVIIWILLAVGIVFLLAKTTFGRSVYAIGVNAEAARYSNIHVSSTLILSYIIAGIVTAVTGNSSCWLYRLGVHEHWIGLWNGFNCGSSYWWNCNHRGSRRLCRNNCRRTHYDDPYQPYDNAEYGGCRKADCSRVDHCDSPGCRLFKK